MSLLQRSKEGKVLYGIATENWRTHTTGFVYIHAWDRSDAVNQILQSKVFGPAVRIVAIAPAVGVWEHRERDGSTTLRM